MKEISVDINATEEIEVTKDDRYEMPSNLTREQRRIFESCLRMGLNPYEYYDFEKDEVLQAPPPSPRLKAKLNRHLTSAGIHLDRLERKLGIDKDK